MRYRYRACRVGRPSCFFSSFPARGNDQRVAAARSRETTGEELKDIAQKGTEPT
jgi:hypothetical protein